MADLSSAIIFLDPLRSTGWTPGPVPANVVYTYAHLEWSLASPTMRQGRRVERSAASEPPRKVSAAAIDALGRNAA